MKEYTYTLPVRDAGVPDKNNRIFPLEQLEKIVQIFNERIERTKMSVYGELGAPIKYDDEHIDDYARRFLCVHLDNVSHAVKKLEVIDGKLVGTFKLVEHTAKMPPEEVDKLIVDGSARFALRCFVDEMNTDKKGITYVTSVTFVTVDLVATNSETQELIHQRKIWPK